MRSIETMHIKTCSIPHLHLLFCSPNFGFPPQENRTPLRLQPKPSATTAISSRVSFKSIPSSSSTSSPSPFFSNLLKHLSGELPPCAPRAQLSVSLLSQLPLVRSHAPACSIFNTTVGMPSPSHHGRIFPHICMCVTVCGNKGCGHHVSLYAKYDATSPKNGL